MYWKHFSVEDQICHPNSLWQVDNFSRSGRDLSGSTSDWSKYLMEPSDWSKSWVLQPLILTWSCSTKVCKVKIRFILFTAGLLVLPQFLNDQFSQRLHRASICFVKWIVFIQWILSCNPLKFNFIFKTLFPGALYLMMTIIISYQFLCFISREILTKSINYLWHNRGH